MQTFHIAFCFTGTLLVRYYSQSQLLKLIEVSFIGLCFICLVVEMDSTHGRAQHDNENNAIFLLIPAVISAIKIIMNKKKGADKEFIFDYLPKSLASNIEIELLEHNSSNTYRK